MASQLGEQVKDMFGIDSISRFRANPSVTALIGSFSSLVDRQGQLNAGESASGEPAPRRRSSSALKTLTERIGRSEVSLLIEPGEGFGAYVHKFVDRQTGEVIEEWPVKPVSFKKSSPAEQLQYQPSLKGVLLDQRA